jgi:uncharacterized delta-60 repeat protein
MRARLASMTGLSLMVLSCLGGVGPPAVLAAPGELDEDFGFFGVAIAPFTGPGETSEARAILREPGGGFFIGGAAFGAFHIRHFPFAGFDRDGHLDTSLGVDGVLEVDFGRPRADVNALARQPDGKIVAAGSVDGLFALARFCPDLTLDDGVSCGKPGFGTGGRVTTDFGPFGAAALAVAIAPGGDIIAAGFAHAGHPFSLLALARYDPAGRLDPTFGVGGRVLTNCRRFGADDFPGDALAAVAVRPDGRILGVGWTWVPDRGRALALMQYLPDGRPDPRFGAGPDLLDCFMPHRLVGPVLDVLGDGRAVVLHEDGRFSVAGAATWAFRRDGSPVAGREPGFLVWRFLANGTPDASFGAGGARRVLFDSGAEANALVARPDGSLVVAGCAGCVPAPGLRPPGSFALARLNPDGSLDLGFGEGGRVTTGFESFPAILALVRQPDDRVVAAGRAQIVPTISGQLPTLARYDDSDSTPRWASLLPLFRGLIAFVLFGPRPTAASLSIELELGDGQPRTIPIPPLEVRAGAYELGVLAQLPPEAGPGKARLRVFAAKQLLAETPLAIQPPGSAEAHATGSLEALGLFAGLDRAQSVERLALGADAAECRARRHAARAALTQAAQVEVETLRALYGKGAPVGPATALVRQSANELSQELHRALDCR